jgi:hypothetical protein
MLSVCWRLSQPENRSRRNPSAGDSVPMAGTFAGRGPSRKCGCSSDRDPLRAQRLAGRGVRIRPLCVQSRLFDRMLAQDRVSLRAVRHSSAETLRTASWINSRRM